MVAVSAIQEPKTIEDRVAAAANHAGEDRVNRYYLRVNHMRKLGVLVDLDIHGFSMFTKRVRWVELGIPAGDARSKQFTSGSKHLIPRKYIKRFECLDSRFRNSLKRYSLETDGFRPYRWISYKAYPKWKEEMAGIGAELDALKAEIIDAYPAIRAEMVEQYTEIAHKVWDANVTRRGGSDDDALDMGDGLVFQGREALVKHIVDRALSMLPTPEEVNVCIYVSYRTAAMLSQADVEEDHLAAEMFRTAAAKQAESTAYWDEKAEAKRRLVREEEDAERRVIHEREWAQRDMVREAVRERRIENDEREIALQTMREEERRRIRRIIHDTISPMEEGFLRERAALHQGLVEVVDAIKDRGCVHGKRQEKMQNLIERYRNLASLLDGGELDIQLDSLEEALARRVPHPNRKGETQVDAEQVTQAAMELIQLTADAARRMAQEFNGTRAGALMI
jgi:hypothetical protein